MQIIYSAAFDNEGLKQLLIDSRFLREKKCSMSIRLLLSGATEIHYSLSFLPNHKKIELPKQRNVPI